ncbi:MAG: sulfatase [Pirellulales bacterium]|nr:sulfatase [Pirellulales bacterium]
MRSAIIVLLFGLAANTGQSPLRGAEPRRPNMVFVLVDDLRWDDLGCAGHPFVRTPHIDRIAREGARFPDAFVTTPLCSPSRASFLTGRYAHAHGITDNTDRSEASHRLATFPRRLQEAGYETAFVGKWHMGNTDSPRPGFDHWVALAGQGTSLDPRLNVNGTVRPTTGHVTDVLNRAAVEFLEREHAKPFLLYLAHKAIHPETAQRADGTLTDPNASNFIPAERHARLFEQATIPRRANFGFPPADKPALSRPIEGLPPLGPATVTTDEAILGRLRMLAAVDEGVGEIFRALADKQCLDDTVVVLAGDNGYFYGEHGLSVERRLAYEESIRIPLLVRYPRRIAAGSQPRVMALNIDLAPTLLEFAGVTPAGPVDGVSLVSALAGKPTSGRDDFLIEYYTDKVFPRMDHMGYRAVRSQRWKYIHYTELPGMDELYDLQTDPFELSNRATAPEAQPELQRLRQRLDAFVP